MWFHDVQLQVARRRTLLLRDVESRLVEPIRGLFITEFGFDEIDEAGEDFERVRKAALAALEVKG